MADLDEVEDILPETSLLDTSKSSPLRRKSILPKTGLPTVLVENNDEAERLKRRQGINFSPAPSIANQEQVERRNSLGLGFIAKLPSPHIIEHISQCITLNAENKINVKNAFNLQVIDFLTYMVKKDDNDMSNLQVASMSLDVSSKIYGYRVDGLHSDMLKIAMRDKEDEIPNDDADNSLVNCEENQVEKRARKKKKNKHKIFGTQDSLMGSIESIKLTRSMIENSGTRTTDELCQVKLPSHANSGCYAHPYNDVIVDQVEKVEVNLNTVEITIPDIEILSKASICPPLSFNFEFHGWTDNEDEDENDEAQPNEMNESGLQFDLDASVPADNESVHFNAPDFDINEEEDENLNRCAQIPDRVDNIVDFLEVAKATQMTKIPEYSFIQTNKRIHWAGLPLCKNNFRNMLGNSRAIETCGQKPARKKKELEIFYNDDAEQVTMLKFAQTQSAKRQERIKTQWANQNLTLPQDLHYDSARASKLYFHHTIEIQLGTKDELNSCAADGIEIYNYNNEHDTSDYCPNIPNEDYANPEENNDQNENEPHICLGDNLVPAPKLANKLYVPYSLRAKKIDMRKLKGSIWKCLISSKEKEDKESVEQETLSTIESKNFSEIYETLPSVLSESNAESLSFPIAFVSLLHLANEKTLKLSSSPDMSDIIVEGD